VKTGSDISGTEGQLDSGVLLLLKQVYAHQLNITRQQIVTFFDNIQNKKLFLTEYGMVTLI
jgi:hypothetical protein